MKKKLFLSMTALLACFTLSAVDIYVNPASGNDANNGSQAAPMKTIESAIFSLKDNTPTTIHIAPNSVILASAKLNLGSNKKLEIVGKNVTIKAAELAAQTSPTGPLLGQGDRIILGRSGCDLKIKGITFMNGRCIDYYSGGAIFFDGNTLEIDSCKFINNQAGASGGAIAARGKSIIIKNSYFEGNNLLGGGARGAAIMQCGPALGDPGTLVVQNCTFYKNMTQSGGAGSAINIYDSSTSGKYSNMGLVEVTNCTFLENTSPTPYQAVIDVCDGDPKVYLTNNTFYKNSDCAFRLLMNKAYLANNVIVAGKQGIMSEAKVADGRDEMVAVNNVVVGTEGGVNQGIDDACFNSAAATNSNVVKTTATYPLAAVGLASTLAIDNFVPYLPITASTSALVNAGTENTTVKFGANYVLAVDTRGLSTNNRKDIGAYEFEAANTVYSPEYIMDNYRVSQSGNTITVKSLHDKPFSMAIVNMTGRTVYSAQITTSVELSKLAFGHGVFVLLFNDGSRMSSQKVLF
ncbi:MAG: right-handed parallel beta-helix repeat-containing protein [Paludibacter sp.]